MSNEIMREEKIRICRQREKNCADDRDPRTPLEGRGRDREV